jgi:hypothetical protein
VSLPGCLDVALRCEEEKRRDASMEDGIGEEGRRLDASSLWLRRAYEITCPLHATSIGWHYGDRNLDIPITVISSESRSR